MSPAPDSPSAISRREAIRRASLFLGAALSPSLLAAAAQLPATVAKDRRPHRLGERTFDLAAAVAERIIPRTDTPGAQDVGVPEFIDLVYGDFMTPAEQAMLTGGLEKLETASRAGHGAGFVQLPPEQQDTMLRDFAAASPADGASFFLQIRELTVLGYFTSEMVQKNVLHYDPVPGRYDADLPISETGRAAWTT